MLQQGQTPAISFYLFPPSKPDLTSPGLSFPLTSIFQRCFVFIDSSFQPQSPDLASAGFLLGLLPESPAELRMWFCQSNCGLLLKGIVHPVPPTVCPGLPCEMSQGTKLVQFLFFQFSSLNQVILG